MSINETLTKPRTRPGRRRVCAACRAPLVQPVVGRPRQYCSAACRQAAWARSRTKRQPNRDAWWTPAHIRQQVLDTWPITLDAAACVDSRLVPNYLGPDHPDPARRDALAFNNWAQLAGGGVVWLNCPYSPAKLLSEFLERAVATARAGTPVVGLLPASTGAAWWWTHIVEPAADIEFLRGRLSFDGPHAATSTGTAPWACALVTWKPATKNLPAA